MTLNWTLDGAVLRATVAVSFGNVSEGHTGVSFVILRGRRYQILFVNGEAVFGGLCDECMEYAERLARGMIQS